jgi:5-methyltetrahydropteroyltriglutamate--homocysteine methyltransferase
MAQATNLGYPRIGPDRELKRATEAYWKAELSLEDLLQTGAKLRMQAWKLQREAGIDIIPCNDFSFYDQVLDAVATVGAVPSRYGWSEGQVGMDTYFAMARGAQREGLDVGAMEMTKWFDTNYHYLVPEYSPGQTFSQSSSKALDEYGEAFKAGIKAKPVLIGPVSLIQLGKSREPGFDPLSAHLDGLVEVYCELIERLAAAGAEWIQLDEPVLVGECGRDELAALERAYGAMAASKGNARLILQTYFGHLGDVYPAVRELPVDGIGLDFVRGAENLDLIRRHGAPAEKWLVAGVVDGRNVWITDLSAALSRLEELADLAGGSENLMVSPSCSLLHVPIDVDREGNLDQEPLARGINGGREAIAAALDANGQALESRRTSSRTQNPTVRSRLAGLGEQAEERASGFTARRTAQSAFLSIPTLLPTTSIGSYPQTPEVRKMRSQRRTGAISQHDYEGFIEAETKKVIKLQENIGLDVLVHGEFERTDMVEYFAQQLEGYAFTQYAWVQSYGSRYVRPPVLYGDIHRPGPMTVRWFRFAQSMTERPVKGMLTGPVTMLQWSFVRDDQPRSDTCRQLALAVRDEVLDLEAAGAKVIQVDEPALREGLPLRRDDWAHYLDWAISAFRLATGGVADTTQIHTHMCYGEFNEIIDAIAAMDADVLLIENARSGAELLEVFKEFNYKNDIGPGIYDIHSPRVPPVDEMASQLRASLGVLGEAQIWVTPDCGLKTRTYEECVPALRNMVSAAQRIRSELDN